MEIYKLIEGYENYEVSTFGNVRSINTDRILKPRTDKDGYLIVGLYKDKIRKLFRIHRLVGIAFIENSNNKACIDHIDRNKVNNNSLNLRWASQSENNKNKSIYKNNSSTVSGVYFNKKSTKWKVCITINGNQKHIGYYANFDEAVQARKEQEEIHYKEFRAIKYFIISFSIKLTFLILETKYL
jgi:hypothetical protein